MVWRAGAEIALPSADSPTMGMSSAQEIKQLAAQLLSFNQAQPCDRFAKSLVEGDARHGSPGQVGAGFVNKANPTYAPVCEPRWQV